MLYTAIFVGLFVIGWLICACIPWLALSVLTRGNAGLAMLPLCLFAGVVAGLAVPVFGLTNSTGLWISFVLAAAVPAILLAVRRFSLGTENADSAGTAARHNPHEEQRIK